MFPYIQDLPVECANCFRQQNPKNDDDSDDFECIARGTFNIHCTSFPFLLAETACFFVVSQKYVNWMADDDDGCH